MKKYLLENQLLKFVCFWSISSYLNEWMFYWSEDPTRNPIENNIDFYDYKSLNIKVLTYPKLKILVQLPSDISYLFKRWIKKWKKNYLGPLCELLW